MNDRLLEQIVKLMAANDLNMVDVRDGDKRVIVKRGPAMPPQGHASAGYAVSHTLPPQAAPLTAPSHASGAGGSPAPDEDAGLRSIRSEMVGTFYSKPSPDAKPFVGVGSQVDEETVVCV